MTLILIVCLKRVPFRKKNVTIRSLKFNSYFPLIFRTYYDIDYHRKPNISESFFLIMVDTELLMWTLCAARYSVRWTKTLFGGLWASRFCPLASYSIKCTDSNKKGQSNTELFNFEMVVSLFLFFFSFFLLFLHNFSFLFTSGRLGPLLLSP